MPGRHHAAVVLTKDTTTPFSLAHVTLRYVLVTEAAVVISTAHTEPFCETRTDKHVRVITWPFLHEYRA